MTYPRPDVVRTLNDHFVCHTVNTKEPGEDGRALLRTYRLLWEPGFVFLDYGGAELRRFVGFRPPAEFMAELQMVLGLVDLLHNRAAAAAQRFHEAADLAGAIEPGPEALYWEGIAIYRRQGRSLPALSDVWAELDQRFPSSSWRQRADVLSCRPTGRRE